MLKEELRLYEIPFLKDKITLSIRDNHIGLIKSLINKINNNMTFNEAKECVLIEYLDKISDMPFFTTDFIIDKMLDEKDNFSKIELHYNIYKRDNKINDVLYD
jgi:hypothetical protein